MFQIRIPIIKIKSGDYEHVCGLDSHDTLHIDDETGGIQYLNLQCCEGTEVLYGEKPHYSFVGEYNAYSPYKEIEFVGLEEFCNLIEKALEKNKEDTKKLKAWLKTMFDKYDEEDEEESITLF